MSKYKDTIMSQAATKSLSNMRWFHKTCAYVLSVLMIVYPVAPTFASVVDNWMISDELNQNPYFIYADTTEHLYEATPFIDQPVSSSQNLESFYQSVLDQYREGLEPPTYVPIMVGDITTIIPIYEQYKYVGTPIVQERYIRSQIYQLLGRTLIDSEQSIYASETAQINTLYNNALTYLRSPADVTFGQRLALQVDNNGLSYNFVWPELRELNGQEVLVPIVYLSGGTVDDRRVTANVNEINGDVTLEELIVENVSIQFGRDSFVQITKDLVNKRGAIEASGDLEIAVGGALQNLSGLISANNNLQIGAQSIANETIVYRYGDGYNESTGYSAIAEINATNGNILLRSYEDIIYQGSSSVAGGEITLAADGNIYIGTQTLYESTSNQRGTITTSDVSYLLSSLSAEETIQLIASGQIVIDAAQISSDEGHIELLAEMGISVIDSVGQYQSQTSGKFGKKSVNESIYQTVAIRSILDAGLGVKLDTTFGDITMRAADVVSSRGTSVSAQNRAVNLLMTTETDHYSYSSVSEGLFTTTTVSKGHNIETGVPNSIVGGLAVEALAGINVEYEGNPNLTTEQQLDAIASMPGMRWIDDVRNSPEVNWDDIVLEHETWSQKNTSLSPAFAAVVAIAVAVATGGAGAAAAGAIGATGTTATMVAAGVSSFISQATLAAANGAVNGDIAGAMDDFASSDTLKSLAVAMVTAGAIAELDAAFFNADTASISDAGTAVEGASNVAQAQAGMDAAVNTTNAINGGLSLTAQVGQAITHAVVQAGAQSLILGADLEENFIQSLVSNSLSILGEKLAGDIGEAKANNQIGTATQLISHTAVGCLTGSISSVASGAEAENGCVSGAGGAVIGELIGLAYASNLEEDLDEWAKEQLGEGAVLDQDAVMAQAMEFKRRGVDMAKLGAAITAFAAGGDVDIAAMTGQNAAENNAFFLVAVIAVAAYTSYVSYKEGGLYEGLQAIGRGDDPLAQAINSVAEAGVELVAEHYPEETQKAAQLLNAAGEKISAGVKIVMETEAGETVTRYWNEIPPEDRDALLGAGAVVSMMIPTVAVAKLKTLSNLDVEAGDWVKDSNHPNWGLVSDIDKEMLDKDFVLETEVPDLDIELSDFATVESSIDLTNLHNLSNAEVGEIGEEVAKQFLKRNGFDVDSAVVVKNASDNGIDIIAYAPDGAPAFFEVKASRTGNIGQLSKLQKDSDSFIRNLLDEGGLNGTIRNQNISAELQLEILRLRNQVLSSGDDIRATAIGVDLLNQDILVSKW